MPGADLVLGEHAINDAAHFYGAVNSTELASVQETLIRFGAWVGQWPLWALRPLQSQQHSTVQQLLGQLA